jgi:hypothetical protein
MKKIIMLLVAVVCSTHAGQVNFSGKSVDEIFSALDQALLKAFEGRTLTTQGLDNAGKRDFETTANAALAVANKASALPQIKSDLAQLPDLLSQLMLVIEFIKGQTASAKKNTINDIKALHDNAVYLEKDALKAAWPALQPYLYEKWDADVRTIEVEKSRKEKLLFKSAKLKAEHLLTPEQQEFFNTYMQLSPGRDLGSAEMDAQLLQSGVTSTSKSKLRNTYAIENLTDALGKYAYLLTSGKADAPQRDKVANYAYEVQQQLRNLYGLSKDEALLVHKLPASTAILYKLSSIYKTVLEKLLKELGAA